MFQISAITKVESVQEKSLETRLMFKGGSRVPKVYSQVYSLITDWQVSDVSLRITERLQISKEREFKKKKKSEIKRSTIF